MDEEQNEEAKLQKFDRKFVLVFCGVLILLSFFLIFLSVGLGMSDEIRLLGPGAFPFGVFVIIIGLSVWLAVQVLTGKGSSARLSEHIVPERMIKPFFLFARIFITVALMQFIGFLLAMVLFTFVQMNFFAETKLKLPFIIACSIIIPAAVYIAFSLLYINLPSPAWLPF